MATAITEITPKEKRIYDFRPDYVEKQIAKIKKTFSQRCREDNRLSDEYKAHVKNLDNIFVRFTPLYGFDCKLSLSSVDAKVSFTYILSYVSDTTVSGKATVDSYGDVKISDVRTTDHYSSSRTPTTRDAWWHASAKDACVMNIGGAAKVKYDLKNYEDVTKKKGIPSELSKMVSKPLTYGFLNPYITPSSIPENVRSALMENATNYHKNDSPRDIKIDEITDYHVDELWINYLPYTYEFDVWCEFEGETYKQHCKTISNITSLGQMSDHYEKYLVLLSDARYDFHKKLKNVRTRYAVSILVSLLGTLGLIGLLVFGKQLHVEGLRHFYMFPMILLCGAGIALTIGSIVAASKERELCVADSDYDPKKSHAELVRHLQQKGAAQHREFLTNASAALVAIFLAFGGLGTGAFFLCKAVYAEHFLYTPEIIGTYYSYENGVFEKLTILSCDSEGNVEAISEATYQEHYAKCKETGKITEKDKNGLSIDFSFAEALYTPEKGGFEKTSYAHFSPDYTEITAYSDATMLREENWLAQGNSLDGANDAQLGTYYNYSKSIANILTINSLGLTDEKKSVSFTSTTISSDGYNEKTGEGKLLIVNPDGSCFVDFQVDGGIQVGYLSLDGQIIAPEMKYSKNEHDVVLIDSTEKFLKIKDYAANPVLYVLTKDLDFGGRSISSIASLNGMVFGNGHTIKNFVVSSLRYSSSSSAGLFEVVGKYAVICDLVIENGNVEITKNLSRAGVLVGYLYGTVIDVTASGTMNVPNATHVGGLVGQCDKNGKTIECNYTTVNP